MPNCARRLARLGGEAAIRFYCTASTRGEPASHFDAIFCLAVLRHGDLQADVPERCDPTIAFADVERTVADLTRCLKPGGLLVIWNSHFRLSDMAVAVQYETELRDEFGKWANAPLYGPDNVRLDGVDYDEAVFRKRQGATAVD
jgi:hypothetical protein